MNDENLNVTNDNTTSSIEIDNQNKNIPSLNNNSPAEESSELVKNNNPSNDVTKVKIRDILKQRFKNMRPGFKKAIPLILVGIICFAAGVGVDRALVGRRFGKNLINRPGYNQASPNNRFNGQQGGTKTNPNMNNRPNRKS